MAHWAEIDENNLVVQITVGSNDDPDEGYQWLIDNLGGTWIKCSYNTRNGEHVLEGTPLRWTYPSVGYTYYSDIDAFVHPSPHNGWVLDKDTKTWNPPFAMPDSGAWVWDEESENWKELTPE
jgi:hypothetical protein